MEKYKVVDNHGEVQCKGTMEHCMKVIYAYLPNEEGARKLDLTLTVVFPKTEVFMRIEVKQNGVGFLPYSYSIVEN